MHFTIETPMRKLLILRTDCPDNEYRWLLHSNHCTRAMMFATVADALLKAAELAAADDYLKN